MSLAGENMRRDDIANIDIREVRVGNAGPEVAGQMASIMSVERVPRLNPGPHMAPGKIVTRSTFSSRASPSRPFLGQQDLERACLPGLPRRRATCAGGTTDARRGRRAQPLREAACLA